MKTENLCRFAFVAILLLSGAACGNKEKNGREKAAQMNLQADTANTDNGEVDLPAPYATSSQEKRSDVIGWPAGKTPTAPAGFNVTRFAEKLDHPRWIYVGPNGDVFVSQASTGSGSPDNILLLRDTDHDGKPELKTTFLTGLNQPFGMLIMDDHFYVANTNGVIMYAYQKGQTKITAAGKKILELPAGGYNNHWTRNLLANKEGKKIFVTVGSGSNNGEHGMDNEVRRANILEINPDGSGERIYASGLRNPQGMAYATGTETLWTSVNERDELGDDLVPDYMTGIKPGGFYGWPYSYWGQHPDPSIKMKQRPDLVKKAITPDVTLGAHTASLGLAFDQKQQLPATFRGGAFIGQHGSWNRSSLVGYQVAFVPFRDGKPSGKVRPFLSGFIADEGDAKVYGRPVGVAFDQAGALLVADDEGNVIWRVSANKN